MNLCILYTQWNWISRGLAGNACYYSDGQLMKKDQDVYVRYVFRFDGRENFNLGMCKNQSRRVAFKIDSDSDLNDFK